MMLLLDPDIVKMRQQQLLDEAAQIRLVMSIAEHRPSLAARAWHRLSGSICWMTAYRGRRQIASYPPGPP